MMNCNHWRGRLTNINAAAKRLHAQNCNINLRDILGINTFDVNRKLEIDPHFLGRSSSYGS